YTMLLPQLPCKVVVVDSMLGGIGSTIAKGMTISCGVATFGTGSVVAHRAVDAFMGPRTIQHETVVSEETVAPTPTISRAGSDAYSVHTKAFQDCINSSGNDIGKCQFYMDMLSECRRNSMMNI
ncbi:hypothetical protein HAX54_039897, partial [Datura stramonium]|nr:hypothetical protein [Datura stramonium]